LHSTAAQARSANGTGGGTRPARRRRRAPSPPAQLNGLNFDLLARWSDIATQDSDDPHNDLSGKIIRLVSNLNREQHAKALTILEQLSREDRS
jgi:hypothetical protein